MNTPSPRPRSPLARVVGIALVAGLLTQLILVTSARPKGDPLEVGKPIEREIRAVGVSSINEAGARASADR